MLMFLTMVALKLDGQLPYSWKLVFILPWLSFGSLAISLLIVRRCRRAEMTDNRFPVSQMTGVFVRERVWHRPLQYQIPLGFFFLALGAFIHFFGFLSLSWKLDGAEMHLSFIFAPIILAWAIMWTSGAITSLSLLDREQRQHTSVNARAVANDITAEYASFNAHAHTDNLTGTAFSKNCRCREERNIFALQMNRLIFWLLR